MAQTPTHAPRAPPPCVWTVVQLDLRVLDDASAVAAGRGLRRPRQPALCAHGRRLRCLRRMLDSRRPAAHVCLRRLGPRAVRPGAAVLPAQERPALARPEQHD
eukprot:294904-Prymnesium_polylepis.1